MPFHWKYIFLPVIIFSLSLILTVYFYRLLPGEVAYHFQDGTPDKWLNRGAFTLVMLVPQFLFVLLAGAITWGITRLSARFQLTANPWVEKMVLLMGNLVALPQIILGFAMLDIFSYNAYQIHLMSLWVFTLSVMGGAGLFLVIFFVLATRQVWRTGRSNTR